LALTNWIDTENPFGLAKPPHWWLQQLSLFDPDLVLFPSRRDPMYRLTRRVTRSYGLACVGKLDKSPDTQLYVQLSVLPVISYLPTIQWTMEQFVHLDSCDIWKAGGAEKAADQIEAGEAADQAKIQRSFESDSDALAGSAYRAAKTRLGQTIFRP